MNEIQQKVSSVRSRQQRQWLWRCISWGLLTSGMVCLTLAIVRLATGEVPMSWVVGSLAAGPFAGALWALARPCEARGAAVAIDRSCGLKDRIATALSFMDRQQAEIHSLQIQDAQRKVASMDARQVAPISAPRSWFAGLALSAAALVLVFLSGADDPVSAKAIEAHPVVVSQADRMEESLKELEEFSEQEADPELMKLLEELSQTLEEMKEPSSDPTEALAKLSEMESALEAQQQELAKQDTSESLQEIGKALSLADDMKAAGEAMMQGRLEDAAEELAKLELPQMKRETERAVTEKLDELMKKEENQQGMPRSLSEAASKMSKGLSNGSRSKFKEGAKGLASQCNQQGRRKKLLDLLKKQCNCLCECKSQCENCQNPGQGKGKGGKNWGLGSSGNEPGDKTAKLATNPKMEIKGQQSSEGDVDVETMQSGEQEEEATRQYRKKVDKYKQLSESVLDSEPIPLGHRQTIRRYFELIRPAKGEDVDVDGQ